MYIDPSTEERFNRLLVDYLNTFNLLELNVGICIRSMWDLKTRDADRKLERMNFDIKLEHLIKLAWNEQRSDLLAWTKAAHEKRHERNMYVHGIWACLPHLERGVEFIVAPWMKAKYEAVYPGERFTLEVLEGIVQDIKSCFSELQSLRRKYGI